MKRLLHALAQWWRRVRWNYHRDQAALRMIQHKRHLDLAERAWLGRRNALRKDTDQ